MDHMRPRRKRLAQICAWERAGRFNLEAGSVSCLGLTDEQARLLLWLHNPHPTEPVLVDLDGTVIPMVKFAMDDGIFAVYVMDCIDSPSLGNTLQFAGLYDPKAVTLYTHDASEVLADLPFASDEDLAAVFRESAAEAMEQASRGTIGTPKLLSGTAAEVWDMFCASYPGLVHEFYVEGDAPEDVLHTYTLSIVSNLAPEWTRDLAAAFLGDEASVVSQFMAELPDDMLQLGACMYSSLTAYWNHIEAHDCHPAHRLHAIAAACGGTRNAFVHMVLENPANGKCGTIAFPKSYLPRGAFGAFDTRSWPDSVRSALKVLYPENYGCFHVSDIRRVQEIFTGRLLYEAPATKVCANAWDTIKQEQDLPGMSVLPG